MTEPDGGAGGDTAVKLDFPQPQCAFDLIEGHAEEKLRGKNSVNGNKKSPLSPL
jgi:hypothetical protein